MIVLPTKIPQRRNDVVPEKRLFGHEKSLEFNTLACPVRSFTGQIEITTYLLLYQ